MSHSLLQVVFCGLARDDILHELASVPLGVVFSRPVETCAVRRARPITGNSTTEQVLLLRRPWSELGSRCPTKLRRGLCVGPWQVNDALRFALF